MIFTSALIIWKAFMCITGSESPTTVVFSGGMKPGFKGEDILFLSMRKDPTHAREIVVFNVDGREIPIAHRVIKGCKYFDWAEPPINDASEAIGSERIDKQPDDILAELKLKEQGAEVELKEKEAKLRIEMRLELERKEKLAWLGLGILVVYFCVFIVIVKNAIMNRLESSN